MKSSLLYRVLQNTGLIVLSLGLVYCGVLILRLPIPFWSQLYGLGALFLGILMSLVSFNEIVKSKNPLVAEFHKISCSICGKSTLAPLLIDTIVCVDCQRQMAARLHMSIITLVIALSIPVTYHLAHMSHEIQQQAKTINCAKGTWEPDICRCGQWLNNVCENGKMRQCGANTYCCTTKNDITSCIKLPTSGNEP